MHPTLWFFGVFIASGGGGNILNLMKKDFSERIPEVRYLDIQRFLLDHLWIIAFVIAAALLLFIFWIVLSTISIGGLIHAAGQMKRNEQYRFAAAFKGGLTYFWRILGLGILNIIVIFAFIIILVLLGVAAFLMHTALGFLSLLILIPAFFIGMFIAVITVAMAERTIVLGDRGVFDGIAEGFGLWTANLGPSVIYTLIYLGLGILIGLATLVIGFFTVVPFVAVAFVNLWLALLAGIPVFLAIMVVISGFANAATHLMTTEFYFQVRDFNRPAVAAAGSNGGFPSPPPSPYQPEAG